MTKIALSGEFADRPAFKLATSLHGRVGRHPFDGRMERPDVRRPEVRTFAVNSAPQHLDAFLIKEREALDAAWGCEIQALIAMKRAGTPEAKAAMKAARAATACVVKRIELARAMTLDGLKVKARAALWRRHGEPLPAKSFRNRAPASADLARPLSADVQSSLRFD